MKTYYRRYPRNFSNEYDLCWCETKEERERAERTGWSRIPRRVAIAACQEEKDRREYDRAMSGYAPTAILPLAYAEADLDPEIENRRTWKKDGKYLVLNGYIWEWRWGLNPPQN